MYVSKSCLEQEYSALKWTILCTKKGMVALNMQTIHKQFLTDTFNKGQYCQCNIKINDTFRRQIKRN